MEGLAHLREEVSERDTAQRSLYRSERRLRGILDAADAAFVSMDGEGVILDWNSHAEQLLGWSREEALGRSVVEVLAPRESSTGQPLELAGILGRERSDVIFRDRGARDLIGQLTVCRVPAGGEYIHHAFLRDLTPEHEAARRHRDAEGRLAYQSLHDALTGLPNRVLLLEHLEHALASARRDGTSLAVICAAVDGLGTVTDSLGHRAGDLLLTEIADRLRELLRVADAVYLSAEDSLARLGGDEFAIVCQNAGDPDAALAIGDRISEGMEAPFDLMGERVFVTLSLGVTTSSPDATGEGLLRDAGAAMGEAKTRGRGSRRLFDRSMTGRARDRLAGESELRAALEREELRLDYQPIVSLADGGIVGAEALIRWEHPRRGVLPPAEFLPLAEQTGLIEPIGHWVFREAFAQAARWHELPGLSPPLRVTINLSGRQFEQPGLAENLAAMLDESGVDPARIALEVTETALIDQLDSAVELLTQLQAQGIRIFLDDFGTGYSSLTYLRRLPLDAIKLDRSFVSGLDQTAADWQIVAAVVQLSRAFGMTAIAEGVETETQVACLRDLGCHFAQGYHFARPMHADALTAFLERDDTEVTR